MPTYEYSCQSCGHHFEAVQSMSDEALSQCPQCGQEVKRVLSGGLGIIFKGSGFYKTDAKASPSQESTKASPCSGCCSSDASSCPVASGKA